MSMRERKIEIIGLLLILAIIVGLPLGIRSYDNFMWQTKIPAGAKVFTLSGHAQKGWLLGEIQAYDVIALGRHDSNPMVEPVIEVKKGDLVALKLRSADVTHGFSLKAFDIYIANGIRPGKTVLVLFRADKAGTFIFSCNAFCGDVHQHMHGRLVVRA